MESTRPASRNLLLAILLLLCVAGLVISIHLGGLGDEALCRENGCAVYESSHFFGWSIASIGVAFYAAMLLLWAGFVGAPAGLLRRVLLSISVIMSILAFAVSMVLVKVQLFGIAPICPWCMGSAGICTAILFISIFLFRYRDWTAQPLASIAAAVLLAMLAVRNFSTDAVVARIGGQTISRAEMENGIGPAGRQAEWELYQRQKDWLDQKITDILVRREAAARHMTPGELVQTDVNDPVDKQVDAFMAANSGKLKPEDQDIVRQQMHTRFKADRADSFVRGLMRKYGAVEYLPAPLIDEKDLAALPGEHRGGDARTAPIRLVIFSDFACEYCAEAAQSIQHAFAKYGNRISLTFHYLPLDIHYRSAEAATAAECAAEQNQFWKYHNALMTHNGQLGGIDFVQLASQLGLDQNKFRECLNSKNASDVIAESKKQANLFGIDATPAVFLNGRRIGGALNEAQLLDWMERTLDGER